MPGETVGETEIEPQRAERLIAAGATVIDVRRPYEWDGGRLAGARHVEMNDLPAAAEAIPRDRPLIFYCRGGNRSAMAVEAFRQAGFEAYSIAGGLQAWAEEGRSLDPEDGEVRTPLPAS